jgi:hypothetical protein
MKMNNKVLVRISSPHLNGSYDVFIPINEYVGVVIKLVIKILDDINETNKMEGKTFMLINKQTGEIYNNDDIVRDTNIKNATELLLI